VDLHEPKCVLVTDLSKPRSSVVSPGVRLVNRSLRILLLAFIAFYGIPSGVVWAQSDRQDPRQQQQQQSQQQNTQPPDDTSDSQVQEGQEPQPSSPQGEVQQASPTGDRQTGATADRQQTPTGETQPGSSNNKSSNNKQTLAPPADQRGAMPPTGAPPTSTPTPKRVDNPYPDNPALRDLYQQYSIRGSKTIERFGASIFTNGSGNTDKLSMDIPAGPDYVLGSGDTVMIDVSGGAPQRLRAVVDPEGRINLPGGGTLLVTGLTIEAAERAAQEILVRRFNDARVVLSLTRIRTIRVYVVGDVLRPGAYEISALSTVLNGLYAAGGPTDRGSLRLVRHYRGDKLVATVDLYDLMLHGMQTDGRRLQSGDSILVSVAGPQVVLEGAVRRPAMYELRNEQTLQQVLELAGGTPPEASLWQISIDRVEAHQRHVTLTVPIPPHADAAAVKAALVGFEVQDGDRIFVAPINPFADKSVYLEGHVFRAGKYAYRNGMTVTDLVRSYSDLLPEPGNQAEIIRLEGPELRPTAIKFDIANVLESKAEAPELRPFDVIRIYGRYAVDPPKVLIAGEVLRPGTYPLTATMRVSDLIRLAGGYTRSAYRDNALLASYQVQNGESVQIEQKTVNLLQIAAGDLGTDYLLKSGDQVSIRQMTGWRNIGASITLTGEVKFPGAYGIEPGEHLSSVVRRAGGFLPESYPPAAVFERQQVKEISEQTKLTIIRKIQTTPNPVKWTSDSSGMNQAQVFDEQKKEMLAALKSEPASGRLVIKISSDIAEWENTPVDLELRSGDTLHIPKQPGFVMVTGQVNNTTALVFTPGKSLGNYLKMAGGPTSSADTKNLYLIRASGRVVGKDSGHTFRSVQDVLVGPGDTVVVPEKIRVESDTWKNVLSTAQFISALAITAAVVKSF
jgi:protein involved in polysaccharide export with SLBB domain